MTLDELRIWLRCWLLILSILCISVGYTVCSVSSGSNLNMPDIYQSMKVDVANHPDDPLVDSFADYLYHVRKRDNGPSIRRDERGLFARDKMQREILSTQSQRREWGRSIK